MAKNPGFANQNEIDEEIKKIRKKLKQIANLERKDHLLTHKEKNKISKKSLLRKELQAWLPETEKEHSPVKSKPQKGVTSNKQTKTKPNKITSSPSKTVKKQEKRTDLKKKESPSVVVTTDRYDLNTNSNHPDEDDDESDNEAEDELNHSDTEDELPEDVLPEEDAVKEEQKQDVMKTYDSRGSFKSSPSSGDKASQITQSSKSTEKPQSKQSSAPQRAVTLLKEKWQEKECIVEYLEGHNDVITSLAVHGSHLVTASRDTTIKVWNIEEGCFVRSLGGHTETVTCVTIVTDYQTDGESVSSGDVIIISGSTDCCFKLWSLQTGSLIRSVYTYNPITSLVYSSLSQKLVTASGGGKLELWNLTTFENVHSIRNQEDAITCVTVREKIVYTGSDNGVIKVYEIRDNVLHCLKECDNVQTDEGHDIVSRRYVRCLACDDRNVVYYGDDAVNIKAISWKKGSVAKYSNHIDEFAATDSIYLHDNNLMVTSSYNLDHGHGYFNVRELPSCEYQFSINDGETERILCLACTSLPNNDLMFITGGLQLKTWRIVKTKGYPNDERYKTKLRFITKLSRKASDSDNEDEDSELEDEDEDEDDIGVTRNKKYLQLNGEETDPKSWTSWCNIL